MLDFFFQWIPFLTNPNRNRVKFICFYFFVIWFAFPPIDWEKTHFFIYWINCNFRSGLYFIGKIRKRNKKRTRMLELIKIKVLKMNEPLFLTIDMQIYNNHFWSADLMNMNLLPWKLVFCAQTTDIENVSSHQKCVFIFSLHTFFFFSSERSYRTHSYVI